MIVTSFKLSLHRGENKTCRDFLCVFSSLHKKLLRGFATPSPLRRVVVGLVGFVGLLFFLLFFSIPAFAQTSWQSELVKVDGAGRITYVKDADGFVIPDFSHAGYKGGEPVPDYQPPASRTETVTPIPNADNTNNIQQAINKIAALAPDADGFRGVVRLGAGKYLIDGTINLNVSGIVLRGAGRGRDVATDQLTDNDLQNMTLIYRRGTGGGLATNVIVMGPASASSATWGLDANNETNKVNITTSKLMPGDFSFEVQSTAGYAAGDAVCIKYPSTEALLAALWYGGNTNWVNGSDASQKWKTSDINICYYRYIVRIDGNQITLDAPVFYGLDRQYSQAYMHKITTGTIYTNIGIEDLRVSMDRTPESITTTPDQNCIKMNALENCWAKGLHLSDFIRSGIQTEAVTRSTIEDCRAVDCSGFITGSSQYNFNNYHRSQLILFKNCFSRNGRHHWISNGCATTSGIVVLNHTSTLANAASEGHRYLSQGILIDGWKETGAYANNANKLGFYLRDNMGTYHGWGAIFSVFWNCDVQNGSIYLDKVPTGQNYSIGSVANTVREYRNNDPKYTMGYNEGQNKPGLFPKSLYEAQLNARKIFAITENPQNVHTCANTAVQLSVTVQSPDPNVVTYRWKKDGNYIKDATQRTLTINRATTSDVGVYTVEVQYAGISLESDPAELTITEPLPELQFSVFPETFRIGKTYQIMVGDPQTGAYPNVTDYFWDYTGTGMIFAVRTENPVEITVGSNATDGILRAKVNHPCGTKILERSISIDRSTGYEDRETDGIRIFPNPANDDLRIQNIQSIKHIEIIDASGKKIYSLPVAQDIGELVISLPKNISGIYFVRLLLGSGKTKSYKFMVK